MKLLVKISVGLLLLVFISATCVYLYSIFYKDQIKDEVLVLVNQQIDAEVSLSDVTVSAWRHFPNLTLHFTDLCIKGKEEFIGDTLLFVSKLSLTMDIKQYIKKHEIHFLHVNLETSYINILVKKNGNANYNIIKLDTSTDSQDLDSGRFYLDMEKVVIRDGKLKYHDSQHGVFIVMEGLEHTAKWEIDKAVFDWETTTKIKSFTIDHHGIRYLNKKDTEIDMILEVDNDKSLYTFKENNIRINHFNFGVEGTLGFKPEGYDLDLNFAARETLFKHLFSLMPGVYMEDLKQIKTNGDVAFDGYVKGLYNDSSGLFPAYHVNVKVKNAMFKYDSLPVPVEKINFHLVADNKDGISEHTVIDLKSFKLTMDDNVVDGHLRMEGIDNSKIVGEMKALIDLADLNKIYPIKDIAIAGLVNVDLKISGIYDRLARKFPSVDASVSLSNGFLQPKDYPEPFKEIHFLAEIENTTGKIQDSRAQITKCAFILGEEPFDITGSVTDFEKYTYDLDVKGKLDLSKITALYPIDGLNVTGSVDIDFESNGVISDIESKNYDKISAKGSVKVSDVNASGKLLSKPFQIKDALFTFTPSRILLENLEGKLGNANMKMKGELLHYFSFITPANDMIVGNMKFECDTLNLNEWLSRDSTEAIGDSSRLMKVVELPENIDLTFDSDIACLIYDDMHMTELKGEVRIKDKILTLNETGFNSLGAKFNISGDYNTVNLQNIFFDFKLQILELDINKAYNEVALVRGLAPAARNAFGTLSVEYKLSAQLDKNMQPIMESMEGEGRIRIHEAKLEGMKIMNEISRQSRKDKLKDPTLQDFVIDTEIKGQKLIVKPFVLKFSDFDAEIQGYSELSGKLDYHVRVSMLPFERIRLPFHITGTYDKYKIILGKGKPID